LLPYKRSHLKEFHVAELQLGSRKGFEIVEAVLAVAADPLHDCRTFTVYDFCSGEGEDRYVLPFGKTNFRRE
jgi:hypothetical protein